MIINRKIGRYFSQITLLIIGSFIIAIITYAESFPFWNSALSDLGYTVTPGGHSNLVSFMILSAGLFFCGITFIKIGLEYHRDTSLLHSKSKTLLSCLAGLGCFIFVYPHNINNDIHTIGAACFVAGVWAIATLMLYETRSMINHRQNILIQLILQVSVIGYAICYFADFPIKNIAQKFAVIGLIIALKLITSPVYLRNHIRSSAPDTVQ